MNSQANFVIRYVISNDLFIALKTIVYKSVDAWVDDFRAFWIQLGFEPFRTFAQIFHFYIKS